MASINLSIKYRPIKIGFLVQDGNIDDIVKASGINSMLWGGLYNPVIPVSEDKKFAEQLINLFSVDVLFPVSHTEEIDDLIKKYPNLKDPGHYAENIFYEDHYSKKNVIGFLDSINIINYYWDREFKHKPEEYISNCVLVKWEENDELKHLFSILYGFFPKEYDLKNDFENAFQKGLRSKELIISNKSPVAKELNEKIYPMRFTKSKLVSYGGTWRGDGIFIGHENDFNDLLYFWNLRASGLFVEFFPKNKIARFKGFIETTIENLNDTQNITPNIEDWITIYHRIPTEEAKSAIGKFKSKKRFMFSNCDQSIWNGLNIIPSSFYFEWENILGSIEKSYSRYLVSTSLPEKNFIIKKNREIGFQQLAVSIDPISEFGYSEHTLKPPFIPKLNEFFSRKIGFDPNRIRIERDGIARILTTADNSLSLWPLSHQVIIQKIFELAEIKSEISQPGQITKRIIEKLGGVDGGRIFKISGVRKLLQTLRTEKSCTRGEGTKTIWEEGEFKKHEKLFIETRESSKLKTTNVFDYLLKYDFFRAGLELICNQCNLLNWLSLQEIVDVWTCNYCGEKNKTSLQLKSRGDWRYRKSGLFAIDNNQEGAIPVILTLLVFLRIFDLSELIYSPSLNLNCDGNKCEIDFCVLNYKRGNRIQLAIGECKSEGGSIDQDDIEKLLKVREKLINQNFDCFIVFSKIINEFSSDEIQLFKQLHADKVKLILLTNKELEPYHPYWELDDPEKLPEKYALDMEGMCRNSEHLYFKD